MNTLKDTTVGEVKELIQGHSDETTIRDILRSPPASPLTDKEKAEKIMQIVSEVWDVTIEQIKEKNRKRNIVDARQLFHYFARKYTDLSLSAIGEITMHDHATVAHSMYKTLSLFETDPKYREKFNQIKAKIEIIVQ